MASNKQRVVKERDILQFLDNLDSEISDLKSSESDSGKLFLGFH